MVTTIILLLLILVSSIACAQVDAEKDLDVNIFAEISRVDVVGVSKGRGFSGVVKRHGFGGGRRVRGPQEPAPHPGLSVL